MFFELIIIIELLVYSAYKFYSLRYKYYSETISPEGAYTILSALLQKAVRKDLVPEEFLVKFGAHNSKILFDIMTKNPYGEELANLGDLTYFKYRETNTLFKTTDLSYTINFKNEMEQIFTEMLLISVVDFSSIIFYEYVNYIYYNQLLKDKSSYIFAAIENNYTEKIDAFFRFVSPQYNFTNPDGDNLFTFAAKRNDHATIFKLMDKRIEIEQNINNYTAIDITKKINNNKMTELLSKYQQNLADYKKCVQFIQHIYDYDIKELSHMIEKNSSLAYKIKVTPGSNLIVLECFNSDHDQLLTKRIKYDYHKLIAEDIVVLLHAYQYKEEPFSNYMTSKYFGEIVVSQSCKTALDSIYLYSPKPLGLSMDYLDET